MQLIFTGIMMAILLSSCNNQTNSENQITSEKNAKKMTNNDKVADYDTDPNIERRTKEFLKALNSVGGKPMEQMTAAEARAVLEGAQKSVEVDESGIDIVKKNIVSEGLDIKLYIVRPAGIKGTLPVFMFFHGGGWVLGDFATHRRFVRDLVVYSEAACVFVEYTRSPEAKYPVAINEAYAATKWVAANGKEIGVDGNRLAVVGNSVGGNMAASVALMAGHKQTPKIKFQLLFWPVTNADFETGSYHQYATSRFLTKNMMIWFWDNYIPKESRNEIYASPLAATETQLKELPPTLVQTAENDVLRDEGESYARKIDAAGVDVTLMRVQGMIHDYGLLNPLAQIPAVQSALRSASLELKNALK